MSALSAEASGAVYPDHLSRAFGAYRSRKYHDAMTVGIDRAIGRTAAALRARGMWDTSLFVFASDNGGRLDHHISNYPLAGGKYSNLQGGVRVRAAIGELSMLKLPV